MATSQKMNLTKVEVLYVPAAKIGEVFMKAQLGLPEAFLDPKDMEVVDMPGINAVRRPANHPRNLETIYKHYQQIQNTSDERAAQLKVRSMTVGDALRIDNRTYYVMSSGFGFKDAEGNMVAVTEENFAS